ncbi:MAG: response regulator [Polyangiaceae bacterium]|nr:response regulator [Polyangiaceae bacterium]
MASGSTDDEHSAAARNIERLEQAKAAAEETTARLMALQRMTADLADAKSRVTVAEIIVDHLGAMLPNCKAMVATLSPGADYVDCVRGIGHSRESIDRYDRKSLSFSSPLTDAIRHKALVILESAEDYRTLYPALASMPGSEDVDSVVAVPFLVDGRAIGGMAVRFSPSKYRKAEDQDFILHVARTCTQCLERACLHEAERAARAEIDTERRRLGLLAEASAVLNTSLDASAITDALAHVTVPSFAHSCLICTVTGGGAAQFENVVHEDPEQEKLLREVFTEHPLDPHHPLSEAARTGKPRLLSDVDDDILRTISANERHLDILRGLTPRSVIIVPLIARGETVGVLAFGNSQGQFSPADVVFAEEIAHRTAMALHNARLYHEAQEANRVKDEFLGVVSHELRTPLNAILGWARMLRTGAVREGAQPRALEAIERNASHQARLIDDLLDASRITAGKLRLDATIVDLGQVVEAAIQSVSPGATAKGIRIQTTCESTSLPVFADPSRLQQIVWNLLSNAIKFTPKEGAIDVRVLRDGDEGLIRVSDNGRGIRADLIPHIFDRFRQGDGTLTRNSGGLGLGLSIVRHLVEAHGGTVQAHSPGLDMGSTFTVRLPISKPKTITPPNPIAATQKQDGRKLTGLGILIIDDEPDAREILEEVLTIAGASVKPAADAAEAIRILNDFTPDVIISDLAMPGEDGLSLMRKIRARAPDRVASVPAIALTAYTRTEDRVLALNAGFQLHVPKPVDPTELVATVASLRTLIT